MDQTNGIARSRKQFAAEAGVSEQLLWRLPPEKKPKDVRLGRKVLVLEQPLEWARRVGRTA